MPQLLTWLEQAGDALPSGWKGPSPIQVFAAHFERLADRQATWPKAWGLNEHKDKVFDLLRLLHKLGAQFQPQRLEKVARWSSRPDATQAWLRNMLSPSGDRLPPRRPRVRA